MIFLFSRRIFQHWIAFWSFKSQNQIKLTNWTHRLESQVVQLEDEKAEQRRKLNALSSRNKILDDNVLFLIFFVKKCPQKRILIQKMCSKKCRWWV